MSNLPSEIVIATHNRGKIADFRKCLPPSMRVLSGEDVGLPSPDETGTTYLENARLKAHAAARALGKIAIADDSGIGFEGLDGAPGVYTADWAIDRNYPALFTKIDGMLMDKGAHTSRRATASCTLVVAWPDGRERVFEAHVEGDFIYPPRGTFGFGLDPVFRPDGHDLTFAEMPRELKLEVSHRGRATAQLRDALAEIFAADQPVGSVAVAVDTGPALVSAD